MDVHHDRAEFCVDLFGRPGDTHRVLRHFEPRGRNAAGIGSLARGEEQLVLLEDADGIGGRGHVRPFGYADAAVVHERLRLVSVQLVLRGARHGDVALHAPRALAGVVLGRRIAVGVLLDTSAEDIFQFHYIFQFCLVDAFGVVDVTRRIGERHDLRTELRRLLAGILCHVARSRDADGLAFERLLARGEHLLCEVAGAVARRFGAQRAAAPVASLAGERSRKFVAQALVLSEHEAYLTAADADVACRDVGVLSDVALQFGHERLAEFHHLVVRAPLGVEIRAALAAAHRQRREAVLEGLFEGEELQDRQVDRRVEADAALVGADGAVHLHAVAAVDLDLAFVIEPGHTENDDALGFRDAFQNFHFLQYGARHDVGSQRFGDLADGLVEFRLIGIAEG